ncbi:ankyrin repeat domain-containing protein [Roseofilum reptotaenium CS-1145]|nr:ankyrin repeat domain-containing protein [Roseofilum reptotaenium CS-1145]
MDWNSLRKSLSETQRYEKIHYLAEEGNSTLVKTYLQCKGDPNVVGANGVTPLYLAAREGHFEVVRLLVENGAEVNQKVLSGSRESSAIFTAIYYKRDRIVEFLLKNGVEPDIYLAAALGDLETLKHLLADEDNINSPNTNLDKPSLGGASLLHLASCRDSLPVTEFLLEKGADIHIRDTYGDTPLHDAARRNALAVARLLIDRGAKLDAEPEKEDTPLHRACRYGHVEMIELLLDNGAERNALGWNHKTPINEAIQGNYPEAVKVLIDRGVYLGGIRYYTFYGNDNTEHSSKRPLTLARELGDREEIIELLIANGAKEFGDDILSANPSLALLVGGVIVLLAHLSMHYLSAFLCDITATPCIPPPY